MISKKDNPEDKMTDEEWDLYEEALQDVRGKRAKHLAPFYSNPETSDAPEHGPIPELYWFTAGEQIQLRGHRETLRNRAWHVSKDIPFGERLPSREEIHEAMNLTAEEAEDYHRILKELDEVP